VLIILVVQIASFLRVYKNHFDPTAIGEFLGEGGVTPAETEYWSQIRFRFIRAVTFIDRDLEPALRILLTECGFRLPGALIHVNNRHVVLDMSDIDTVQVKLKRLTGWLKCL